MKVRLHHQYIRFRLEEVEVEQLCSGQPISTKIQLGVAAIIFELALFEGPKSRFNHARRGNTRSDTTWLDDGLEGERYRWI